MMANLSNIGHFEHITTKLRGAAFAITSLICRKSSPTFSVIRLLVNSIMLPIITYSAAFWRPSDAQLESMQSLILLPLRRYLALPWSAFKLAMDSDFNMLPLHLVFAQALIRLARTLQSLDFAGEPQFQQIYKQERLVLSVATNFSRMSLIQRILYAERKLNFHFGVYPIKPVLPAEAKLLLRKVSVQVAISSIIANQWGQQYKLALGPIIPSNSFINAPWMFYDNRPAAINRARLRLGYSNVKSHLLYRHRISIEDSLCEHCGYPETVQHVLLDCQIHTATRLEYLSRIRLVWPDILQFNDANSHLHIIIGHYHDPLIPAQVKRNLLEITGNYLSAIAKQRQSIIF